MSCKCVLWNNQLNYSYRAFWSLPCSGNSPINLANVVLYTLSVSFTNMIYFSFHPSELIENVKLIHKPVSLQPRGLINKGNWCYINAVSFFASVHPVLLNCLNNTALVKPFLSYLFILTWLLDLDPAGPDCVSPHVSSDEVYSPFQWDSESLHIHTHDG